MSNKKQIPGSYQVIWTEEIVNEDRRVEANCSAIKFINTGEVDLWIFGQVIPPNHNVTYDTRDIQAVDNTIYELTFKSRFILQEPEIFKDIDPELEAVAQPIPEPLPPPKSEVRVIRKIVSSHFKPNYN